MKKWLESLNPISLTTLFCRTRLLVYSQQLGSFPRKLMATNHTQETPYILLSSPINMDEFHERERRKFKKKKKEEKTQPKTTIFATSPSFTSNQPKNPKPNYPYHTL
jgi:hypothetical protein